MEKAVKWHGKGRVSGKSMENMDEGLGGMEKYGKGVKRYGIVWKRRCSVMEKLGKEVVVAILRLVKE